MIRSFKRSAAVAAVALGAALGSADLAQATDYGGYTLLQLRQGCMAQGQTQNPFLSPGNYVPASQVGYGSQGICTALAQALTNAKFQNECVGNTPLAVDGIDGPLTTAAVTCVQKLTRLQQDGIVGPYTWGVLWFVN